MANPADALVREATERLMRQAGPGEQVPPHVYAPEHDRRRRHANHASPARERRTPPRRDVPRPRQRVRQHEAEHRTEPGDRVVDVILLGDGVENGRKNQGSGCDDDDRPLVQERGERRTHQKSGAEEPKPLHPGEA